MNELRRSPRIRTDAMVDIAGTDVLLYHRISDISLGGICLESRVAEPVGTDVELTINFPDMNAYIETSGTVVRVDKGDRPVMAIQFTGLSEDANKLLERYLDLRGTGLKGGEGGI